MKSILYVSAHSPYPAVSGGQVDTWNRLQALAQLGTPVDLVLTLKKPLSKAQLEALRTVARNVWVVRRRPLAFALMDRRPVQMAVRSRLRRLKLSGCRYALVVLDNEFAGEILRNPTLQAARIAIRVQNDEVAYQRKLADAEPKLHRRLYFRMEAARMERYVPRLWRRVQDLWFISSDELMRFREDQDCNPQRAMSSASRRSPHGHLLVAGLDFAQVATPSLSTHKVLFVGTLTVTLNQDALRWYLEHVHPLLLELDPEYRFVIAGSTGGKDIDALRRELLAHPHVELHSDVPDLQTLFEECSAFVSPMRFGAGVKLKTVEAAMRGLPLITTTVGAEGSGLLDGVHCHIEDQPHAFAAAAHRVLSDREHACCLRGEAQRYIEQHYSQVQALRPLLPDLELNA